MHPKPPLVLCLLLLASLTPGFARADRREHYLLLEGAPGLLHLTDPFTHTQRALAFGGTFGAAWYYGLTNTLHLGATTAARLAPNAAFRGQVATLEDGVQLPGDVYEDAFGASLSGVMHYRYDSGWDWAPFAQVELGAAYLRYSRVVHYVSNSTLSLPYPGRSELVPTAAFQAGIEYRFLDRYTASAGLALRASPFSSSSRVWALDFPLNIGMIWW